MSRAYRSARGRSASPRIQCCSLAQGRLFAQLTALRVGHSQMHPASIRGALSYIAAILGAPILPKPRT
jgi:hypothetical protein